MRIVGIDHLAVAVEELGARLPLWETLLGVKALPTERIPQQGVVAARLEPPGTTAIELIAPLGADSPISGFLKKRGEGIHHLCLEVEDLASALLELKALGFRPIEETPSEGASGKKIVFLHPKSSGGVLVELSERRSRGTAQE